ncbi:MAG: hypothetical protein MPW13_19425 [Candidatus Manganitrophus sp.]|nr:hypothetical protein [Candidatus Manganitrophus sp.]
MRQLLAAGHSLVVIEHNLDVIRASDWIIDLGPEGGDAGGEIVCAGTPEEVAKCDRSHTGVALKAYAEAVGIGRAVGPSGAPREWIGKERCDPDPQRARAQPERGRCRDSARPVHRDHRRERERQEHAGVRHPVQRGAAALPRIAQRLRAAASCSRPAGPTSMRSSASRRRWRSSSGPAAAAARARWRR